jgi:hypothetical protein
MSPKYVLRCITLTLCFTCVTGMWLMKRTEILQEIRKMRFKGVKTHLRVLMWGKSVLC